jgi:hypothetical protein
MTLIKKIQLAAEQNNFEVYVTGDKRKLKFWNVGAHKGQRGLPYKAIVGNYKMFPELCSNLVQKRKGTEGYKFYCMGAGIAYSCKFIDGQFTYVISKNLAGSMILVYKNK